MIAKLRVRRHGINVVPEQVQQLLVADLPWIIHDLDGFRVARAAGLDLLVGRMLGLSSGVAGGHGDDAWHRVEDGLLAPEAAAGEYRGRRRR